MSKNDGGPAFPDGLSVGEISKLAGGMTLRDYFAGQAISGIVKNTTRCYEESVAKEAYNYADAMLKERDK